MYVGIDISVVLFPSYLQLQETLSPDSDVIMDYLQRSNLEVTQVPCGECVPFRGCFDLTTGMSTRRLAVHP
jgi:hypothetical protein